MAISKTRMKFLDKENKILVKDLKDIRSNDIFSNIITPLLDSDLIRQFQGSQVLLSLQDGMQSLYTTLSDVMLSNFVVKNIISGLNALDPALAHLRATLELIKSMDEKSVGVFISTVFAVTADKLYDNPSMIHNYKDVSSDVKTQLLLVALDVYGTRIASGELNMSSVSQALSEAGSVVDGLDTSALNGLLGSIKFTDPGYDMDKEVEGTYELPEDFFDTGSTAGDYETPTYDDPGGESGITAEKILTAYVSLKREMHKLYRSRAAYHDFTDASGISEQTVSATNAFMFPGAQERVGFVTVLHTHNSFIAFIRSRMEAMLTLFNTDASVSSYGLLYTHFIPSFIKSFESASMHPFLLGTKDKDIAIYSHLNDSLGGLKAYISEPASVFRIDHSGVYKPTEEFSEKLKQASALMLGLIDESASKHYKLYKAKDPEVLCIPVLFTQYLVLGSLLKHVQNLGLEQRLAGLATALVMLNGLFALPVGKMCAAAGLASGKALLPYHIHPLTAAKFAAFDKVFTNNFSILDLNTLDEDLKGVVKSVWSYRINAPYSPQELDLILGSGTTSVLGSFLQKAERNTDETFFVYTDREGKAATVTALSRNSATDANKAIDLSRVLFSATDIKII